MNKPRLLKKNNYLVELVCILLIEGHMSLCYLGEVLTLTTYLTLTNLRVTPT